MKQYPDTINQCGSNCPNAERGVVLPLVAISMVLFMAFAALAIDLGYLYVVKSELQRSADNGALGGVAKLSDVDSVYGTRSIFEKLNGARGNTQTYVAKNPAGGMDISVQDAQISFGYISDPYDSSEVIDTTADPTDFNVLQVTTRRTANSPNGAVPLFFGKFFGRTSSDLTATAAAVLDDRFAGIEVPDGEPSVLIPVAIKASCWEDQIVNGNGDDEYGVDDSHNPTSFGDGVPEIKVTGGDDGNDDGDDEEDDGDDDDGDDGDDDGGEDDHGDDGEDDHGDDGEDDHGDDGEDDHGDDGEDDHGDDGEDDHGDDGEDDHGDDGEDDHGDDGEDDHGDDGEDDHGDDGEDDHGDDGEDDHGDDGEDDHGDDGDDDHGDDGDDDDDGGAENDCGNSGNVTVLNIGALNNSTDQIESGILGDQIANEFGSNELMFVDDGSSVDYQVTGNPELDANVQQALEERLGEVVGFFVYDEVLGESEGESTYNITGIQFGQIVEVSLSDGELQIIIQPVEYVHPNIITSEDAESTNGLVGRISLIR